MDIFDSRVLVPALIIGVIVATAWIGLSGSHETQIAAPAVLEN